VTTVMLENACPMCCALIKVEVVIGLEGLAASNEVRRLASIALLDHLQRCLAAR